MYSISSFGNEHPQLHTLGDGKISSPPSESKKAEISQLEHLIRHSSFKELGRFQPLYPAEAAKLCHELVLDHGDAVTTMLVNEKVSEEALKLLAADGQDAQNDLQKKQRLALAEAVLNARPYLAASFELPRQVADLIEQRRANRRDYWSDKAAKHREHKDELVSFLDKGLPFLHKKNDKSIANRNCALGEVGQQFVCRHLTIAIAHEENPKDFLKTISQKSVDGLKYEELEKESLHRIQEMGKTSVQFSRRNFGKLLATIQALKPSGTHSYAIDTPLNSAGSASHAMHVFMERQQESKPLDACLKVSFYEPNVTGDMTHLKALPEELAGLPIDVFDRRSICHLQGTNVLSMDVRDPELALALVSKFVKDDVSSQTSSLATALALGNVLEFEAAASKLAEQLRKEEPANWPGGQVKELSLALYKAMQDGHADTVKALGGFLESIKDTLAPADLKNILLARRFNGTPGLFMAMQNGHTDVVKAYGDLLESVKDKLTREDLEDILLAKMADGAPGLYMAMQNRRADAMKAFGGLLESAKDKLTREDLKDILLATRRDGVPGLFMAMQNGHTDVVKAYGDLLESVKDKLTREDLEDILLARRSDGAPGLYMAMQNRRADAMKAFGGLLESAKDKLTREDLKDILLAKRPDGTSGLYIPLRDGDADTVKASGDLLESVKDKLMSADLRDILLAKKLDGTSGLSMARKHAHADAVKVWGGLLESIKDKLTPEDLEGLLLLAEEALA